MKYQNFIMRILCLLLILAAVVGYNSMQKKDTQAQESQEIAALTKRVEKLEEQNTEMLSALEEAAKNQEAAIAQAQSDAKDKDNAAKEDAEEADTADTEEESDDSENVYKDGTYTGSAQGFGGAITVQVTLSNDEITDIQVTSAPGEDSAYLSQGEGVISSIISAQSTDVDTVSGATFSSTGIINAVVDALGKAEN
nr:FMN-binding protein [uncultured Blautia sp.]